MVIGPGKYGGYSFAKVVVAALLVPGSTPYAGCLLAEVVIVELVVPGSAPCAGYLLVEAVIAAVVGVSGRCVADTALAVEVVVAAASVLVELSLPAVDSSDEISTVVEVPGHGGHMRRYCNVGVAVHGSWSTAGRGHTAASAALEGSAEA